MARIDYKNLVLRLAKLIRSIPEFEDNLDETASPDGTVFCRFCDGGGSIDGRKRPSPAKHRADCPLVAALADTEQFVETGISKSEFQNLSLGIYRVFWKSGGSSLASVGQTRNGNRWLAPINWVLPSDKPDLWKDILRVEAINLD